MPAKKQQAPERSVLDLAPLADPEGARSLYTKGPTCTMALALETLPDDKADLLRKALENASARGVDIADALSAFAFEVTPHTVQRHRRGRCRCER